MSFPILSTECRAQIVRKKSPSESPGLWFPEILKLWPYIYPPFLSRCLSILVNPHHSKFWENHPLLCHQTIAFMQVQRNEKQSLQRTNILQSMAGFLRRSYFSGIGIISGWWFGTCFIFHFIYGIIMIILPIDELHHFSRWAHCTTNQISSFMYCDFLKKPPVFFGELSIVGTDFSSLPSGNLT